MIRHGQARTKDEPYGPETPLGPLGRRQAATVADVISRTRSIAAIYSSPFPRAMQTAQPLCDSLGQVPVIDDRLAEFDLAPQSFLEERQDLLIWEPQHRGVQGGESLEEFALRVSSFIEELCERHHGESIAVFTHSGTIDAVARWAAGLPAKSTWQHDLPISTASITELQIWPQGRVASGAPRYVAFLRVGDVGHLGAVS